MRSRGKTTLIHQTTFLELKEIEIVFLFSTFSERPFFHWPYHSVVSSGLLGSLSWGTYLGLGA